MVRGNNHYTLSDSRHTRRVGHINKQQQEYHQQQDLRTRRIVQRRASGGTSSVEVHSSVEVWVWVWVWVGVWAGQWEKAARVTIVLGLGREGGRISELWRLDTRNLTGRTRKSGQGREAPPSQSGKGTQRGTPANLGRAERNLSQCPVEGQVRSAA